MAGRVSSPVLVGRQVELAAIDRTLERASAGDAVHLLVAGEAGVGKTRLTTEVTRIARDRGFRVLRGESANVGGSSLPYGPLIEALRGLVAEAGPREVVELAGPGAPDLARLVPDFGAIEQGTGSQSEWLQSRLFGALLGLLGRLGERAPVLLVVEDLHWADPGTTQAIAFLVRSLAGARVLVLGTYRSDELHRRHPLLPWLAELERGGHVERLELRRLDRAQVGALMAAIIESAPEVDLVDEVYVRSDGNPFFAEELLAAGRREGPGPRLPPTLRDILLAHLGTAPETAAPVLRVAAVAGRRVEHDLLAEVAGLPEDRLLEGLRAAVGAHLLVVEDDGAGERYAFRHALVQEVVYDELLPGERRSLHRAFAEALDAQAPGSGAGEAGHWAELAHHWAAAREDLRAFAASLRAASAAVASFAFDAALQAYERALELWDGLAEAADVAGFDRIELLRRAGLAAYLAGSYRRAVAIRKEAVAVADPEGDPLRAGILREELGRAYWVLGDASAALEAYRAAMDTIPPEPPTAERARAVSGLGQILMLRSSYEESRVLCEQAIAIARAAGARAQEGHALNTLGIDLATLGRRDEGLAALEAALQIATEQGIGDDIGRAWVNMIEALDESGETERAAALAPEGIRAAEELGIGHLYGYYIRLNAGAFSYALGRWDETRRYIDEAGGRGPKGPGAELYRHTRTLPFLVGEGSFGAADAGLAQAFERVGDNPDAQFLGPIHAAAAERELWRHAPRAALDLATSGLERLASTDDRTESSHVCRVGARAAADLAEAARAVRDDAAVAEARERMAGIREHLLRLPRSEAAPGQAQVLAATLASVDAEATRLEGRADPEAWHAAVEAWSRVGRPYLVAYARWREGEAALAAGDRARATAALRTAHSTASRLGAAPLRGELESLARRARIGLTADGAAEPEPSPAAGADPFGLTPREREVLALVADGRTNRQIAELLFISESTAGVHVSNILGKFGVGSRGEAAAVAYRLHLVPEVGQTAGA